MVSKLREGKGCLPGFKHPLRSSGGRPRPRAPTLSSRTLLSSLQNTYTHSYREVKATVHVQLFSLWSSRALNIVLTSLALLRSLKRLSFPEPTCAIHTNCDVSDVVRSQDVGLQVETDVSVGLHSPASFVSSQVCVQ
jgi:ferric iron reductase protein FhuF